MPWRFPWLSFCFGKVQKRKWARAGEWLWRVELAARRQLLCHICTVSHLLSDWLLWETTNTNDVCFRDWLGGSWQDQKDIEIWHCSNPGYKRCTQHDVATCFDRHFHIYIIYCTCILLTPKSNVVNRKPFVRRPWSLWDSSRPCKLQTADKPETRNASQIVRHVCGFCLVQSSASNSFKPA